MAGLIGELSSIQLYFYRHDLVGVQAKIGVWIGFLCLSCMCGTLSLFET